MKKYNEEEHKWFQGWEKNFDTTLKAVKKFKEDLSNKPEFTPTTARKYRLYFELLEAELLEVKDCYEIVEPNGLSVHIKREGDNISEETH